MGLKPEFYATYTNIQFVLAVNKMPFFYDE